MDTVKTMDLSGMCIKQFHNAVVFANIQYKFLMTNSISSSPKL